MGPADDNSIKIRSIIFDDDDDEITVEELRKTKQRLTKEDLACFMMEDEEYGQI